jgi:uncharacterized lipoprotein YmbA
VFGAVSLFCAAFVLGACGSSLPPTHYYVLELDPAATGSVTSTADSSNVWTIGVRAFAVDSPYDGDRIVYRVGDGSSEVGFYSYHLWAAPLGEMLPALVATGLDGARGASIIEPVVAGRRYDAYLEGRVLALEEIDLADRQQARAEIALRLVGRDGAELWTDVVSARGETRTDQVGQVVDALTTALGESLAGARETLGVALASAPPPTPTPPPPR